MDPDGGAAPRCRGIRRPLRAVVHPGPDGATGEGRPCARAIRRPTPGRQLMVETASPLLTADGGALDPVVGPQCSLAVHLRRAMGDVIGRSGELDAIAHEMR